MTLCACALIRNLVLHAGDASELIHVAVTRVPVPRVVTSVLVSIGGLAVLETEAVSVLAAGDGVRTEATLVVVCMAICGGLAIVPLAAVRLEAVVVLLVGGPVPARRAMVHLVRFPLLGRKHEEADLAMAAGLEDAEALDAPVVAGGALRGLEDVALERALMLVHGGLLDGWHR